MRLLQKNWLLIALFGIQLIMTVLFLDQNYFNDDLEPIAGGRFFSDLYLTQLNVHGPGHIMLDWVWFQVFGATFVSNRILAGLLNLILIWTFWRISNSFLETQNARYVSILSASTAWFLFQSQFWGYLNLSQLTVMVEVMLLISVFFKRSNEKIVVSSPFVMGILLTLIISTRYLQIFQLLALLLVLFFGLNQKIIILKSRFFRQLILGFIGYVVFVLLLFRDRLGELYFWSLLHNLNLRSESVSLMAWVGDLSIPSNRILVLQIALIFVILVLVNTISIFTRRLQVNNYIQLALLVTAVSGWIACNPSGLSSTYFQALPAIGPLCAGIGFQSGMLIERDRNSHIKTKKSNFSRIIQIVLLLSLLTPSIFPTLKSLRSSDAMTHIESAERMSDYIRKHSTPNETIFVFGTNPLIYSISERRSATLASILFPDLKDYENKILEQVVKNRPKFIVFDTKDFFFNSNIDAFPNVTYYILKNYQRSEVNGLLELRDTLMFPNLTPTLTSGQIESLNLKANAIKNGCKLNLKVGSESKFSANLGTLFFEKEGDWSELFGDLPRRIVNSSTGTEIITIRFDSSVKNFFEDGSRFLRLGIWEDDQFISWFWFRVPEGSLNYSTPLNSLLSGTVDKLERLRISIGGWGPANSNLKIVGFNINESQLQENCKVSGQ